MPSILSLTTAILPVALAIPQWQSHPWSGHACSSLDPTGHCAPTAPSPLTSSAASTCAATRTTAYSSFSYTVETSIRYATPVSSPLQLTTSYAPAFSQASALLPSNATYTSYSLNRNATAVQDGTYGQGAYARLWATISYNTTIPFSTTASPTSVASSELIFPPALYTPCPSSESCLDCYKLPTGFIWGVAGSAFQIEGGLDFDGRGPSSLDLFGALPNTADLANAEVADMNYFLYKQDIARLAAIGMPYYSFSIAWTRIVPFGWEGSPINEPGLRHYDDLIDTCLQYGITPVVTLQHADAPLHLAFNDTRYPDAFLYYAKQVMTRYGDRVQYWVTQNEPNIIFGATTGTPYSAATNIMMGHAKVYHWYKEELKGVGHLTFKFANNLALPLDASNPNDVLAAKRYQDILVGILGNPIFLGQQYPAELLNTTGIGLKPLTAEELVYLNGTADFLSLDPYTAQFATSPPEGIDACASDPTNALWPVCVVNTNVQTDGWLMGQASYAYAYIAPQYVRQQLGYMWNTFKPKGILVSEFGFNPWMEWSKPVVDQLYDLERTAYYYGFLREMLKSIYIDGVNVIGALAWSFVDNDEFVSYYQQYGMQHVNRTDGKFTRSYKRSMFDFVDFFHAYVEA